MTHDGAVGLSAEHSSDLVRRLHDADVCVVSDALDALGLTGSVLGIGPMWEGARVIGRTFTVQLAEGVPPFDEPVHLGVHAIMTSEPGDVIVVANGGRIGMGAWGGLLATAAMQRGVAGVVVDGACRDVDEARDMGFPAFARAPIARTARSRAYQESSGEPITIDGVAIRTGDLLMADGSGVVIVAAEHADAVVAKAEELMAREAGMREQLLAGASPEVVLGGGYQKMLQN